MTPRQVAALLLAKMALADEIIDPSERAFLQDMLHEGAEFASVDALLASARENSLESLVERLELYPDRFLIALRVFLMARIDQHLDAREEALFQKLLTLLHLTADDRLVIERTDLDARSGQLTEASPRVEEMFLASSFCDD
jgi:uncharacterized tellurite resistance protein B-like protein